MSHVFRIDRLDQIPLAISQVQAGGAAHRAVLLRAIYRGLIAHTELQRETTASHVKRFIAAARAPALILVGDDDYASTGPDGWRQTTRLMQWARLVIVHAAGADVEQYEAFVTVARQIGRVLLVETDAAHAEAWTQAALAVRAPPAVQLILPIDGLHPVCLPAGGRQ